MSIDRELLDRAAKAARIELAWSTVAEVSPRRTDTWSSWNPLTNDGDALRLAVDLGIQIRQYPIYDTPRFAAYACEAKWSSDAERQVGAEALVNYEGDPYAATRRAIVRAVAEIARSKENGNG